ncbi:hypothetical protein TSUD_321530 [Trifolium subterraneum]|uniref:Uncharacterized protein n=1 Tax=Trifolium subterraneum TaxID=3900 RepID=A0A2Z6NRL7_TRISU|nr:hypothetical protein TSUD_321530 [Trifolium subterraneum]
MVTGEKAREDTQVDAIEGGGDVDEEEEVEENIGMNVEENIVGDYECPKFIFSSKAENGLIIHMEERGYSQNDEEKNWSYP